MKASSFDSPSTVILHRMILSSIELKAKLRSYISQSKSRIEISIRRW